MEEREQKLEILRGALAEGEASGTVEGYSIDAVIEQLDRE